MDEKAQADVNAMVQAVSGEVTTVQAEEQPKAEAEVSGNPGETSAALSQDLKPEETVDPFVEQAMAGLSKKLGKELTKDEAVPEMAKSFVNAENKIQSLSEQVKGLVEYRTWTEQVMANPNWEKALAVLTGEKVDDIAPVIDEFADPDQLSPALAKKFADLESRLKSYEEKDLNSQKTAQEQEVSKAREEIIKWAGEKGNEDFRSLCDDYQSQLKLNPYAPQPQVLKQWAALVDAGLSKEMAWNALHPDKFAERVKANIAKEQNKKPNLPLPNKAAAGNEANLADETDINQIVKGIVQNLTKRS
jgi:hypothetical protein